MGVDHRGQRYCDECGELMQNAHRIHNGHEYCGTCYRREFQAAPCVTCRRSVRVHRNSQDAAVCSRCNAAERQCVRCEKPVPRAGKIVETGVCCPACAPYFRPLEPCERCGTPARALSRLRELGSSERLCAKCRSAVTHATCQFCRRHRKKAGTADGRAYCTACGPHGGASRICSGCDQKVVGGGRGMCRPCLNGRAVRREASVDTHGLSVDRTKDLLTQFADWLIKRSPSDPGLSADYRRHVLFFQQLDSLGDGWELTAQALAKTFGVEGLRRHRLPVQFLESRGLSAMADAQKQAISDQQRILRLIAQAKQLPTGDWFTSFASACELRGQSVRTQRMYLSTALSYLTSVKDKGGVSSQSVAKFLLSTPGAKANLSVFTSYLRESFGVDARVPGANDATFAARQLSSMMARAQSMGDDAPISLLRNILTLSFGVDRATLDTMQLVEHGANLKLEGSNGETWPIPTRLHATARQWHAQRAELKDNSTQAR